MANVDRSFFWQEDGYIILLMLTSLFVLACIAVTGCQSTPVFKHQYSERLERYHRELENHRLSYSDYCTLAVDLVREAAAAEEHGECKK